MLNDLTTQQFFDILTKYQSELCGKICIISMLASLVGTLLYWLLSDVAKLIYRRRKSKLKKLFNQKAQELKARGYSDDVIEEMLQHRTNNLFIKDGEKNEKE